MELYISVFNYVATDPCPALIYSRATPPIATVTLFSGNWCTCMIKSVRSSNVEGLFLAIIVSIRTAISR